MDMRLVKQSHGATASAPHKVGDKDAHIGVTCTKCKQEQRVGVRGFSRPELEQLTWVLALSPSECCAVSVTTELRNVP